MEVFKEFMIDYGFKVLAYALTIVIGAVLCFVSKLVKKWVNDNVKSDVVKNCVTAVEQTVKDLHGKGKFDKVFEMASNVLATKKIKISPDELEMLIESAVGQLNGVFDKEDCTKAK